MRINVRTFAEARAISTSTSKPQPDPVLVVREALERPFFGRSRNGPNSVLLGPISFSSSLVPSSSHDEELDDLLLAIGPREVGVRISSSMLYSSSSEYMSWRNVNSFAAFAFLALAEGENVDLTRPRRDFVGGGGLDIAAE